MKKSVVQESISFDDYKNCLFDGMRKMNVVRSHISIKCTQRRLILLLSQEMMIKGLLMVIIPYICTRLQNYR